LRQYATREKVASLSPNEVHDFFFIYLIPPAAPGLGIYSASNRNEYQKIFLGIKQTAYKADNPTSIYELIV
jgi:hypothetical protein